MKPRRGYSPYVSCDGYGRRAREEMMMKVSLLLTEDGAQITLTPGNSTEEAVLEFLHQEPLAIAVKRFGEFEQTRGGYFREFDHRPNNESTALVLTKSRNTDKAAGGVPVNEPETGIPGREEE